MLGPKSRDTYFASCSPGLEPFLLAEARKLRLARTEGQPGGLQFTGSIHDAYRANLWLRTASRVLLKLDRFPAADSDALYAGARRVDWERFLGPDGTFSIAARCRRSRLDHEVFVVQRVKDAVADHFRDVHGRRPSVRREDPDLRIQVHLVNDRCTLSADTSGESLHKRGWRRHQGPAQLKETIAAACVMASGWDRRAPLLDPFCGSGTILVEGALLAGGYAPGRWRERFGFERWPVHDRTAWEKLRAEARAAGALPGKLTLLGRDHDRTAVAGALANVAAAGLKGRIRIERASVDRFEPRPGWNAFVVTNPPYGERMGKQGKLAPLYASFGKTLKARCGGYTVAVLCGHRELLSQIKLREREGREISHGGLDCRLAVYDIPR